MTEPGRPRRTGRLAEAIERSVVSAHTPNEQVFGEVRGEREIRVWLAPGHYARVTTPTLQQELASLARLLFAAARRNNSRTFEQVTGRYLVDEPPIAPKDVAYAEALRELAAEGVSDDGSVRVTAIGQQNYAVHIAPGTLDRLGQPQFQEACGQAANRLLADTERQAARLRWRIYEPLPGITV